MKTIKIARDFTSTPGGRFVKDGPGSGEEFRDTILVPEIRNLGPSEKLRIDLDGAFGYATSFLEEAFGGLVRRLGDQKVEEQLEFVSFDEPLLEDEIREYMLDARRRLPKTVNKTT